MIFRGASPYIVGARLCITIYCIKAANITLNSYNSSLLSSPASRPLDFHWVTIPAGKFLMGSDKEHDPIAEHDEVPQHSIDLPTYHISRFLVTNAQYKLFIEASGYSTPYDWENVLEDLDKKKNHPVMGVSWDDAQAFCRWAQVTLPSEAEWEKAARGTDRRIYPWGNQPPSKKLASYNWHIGATTPVDAYPDGVSPYGCLDMAGNLAEWTRSKYVSYPYNQSDGREVQESAYVYRVIRGGAYNENGAAIRCANRSYNFPDYRTNTLGFRVAMIDPNAETTVQHFEGLEEVQGELADMNTDIKAEQQKQRKWWVKLFRG